MSDSDPRSLREELELRVVALLTGELSEVDADELEKILTVDAELSAYRDRMAVLIGHVHDARDEIAPPVANAAMRLSPERRAEIFQDVDAAEFEPREEPKRVSWKMRVFEIAAVFAVLFILAGILIPTVGAVKMKSSRVAYEHEARAEERVHTFNMESSEDVLASKDELFALAPELPMESLKAAPQTPHAIKLSPRSKSIPQPVASQSAWGVEVAEQEISDSFEMNTSHGIGGGSSPLGGSLRDADEGDSSRWRSQQIRASEVDKIESDASSVAYGTVQSDGFKKEKRRMDLAEETLSEFVGNDASSMDGKDGLLAMGDLNLGRAGGSGVVMADTDYDASGPVDPFAARSARPVVTNAPRPSSPPVDAFAAPSSGGYAGERSKGFVDRFAAPSQSSAVVSRGTVVEEHLYAGEPIYYDGEYSGPEGVISITAGTPQDFVVNRGVPPNVTLGTLMKVADPYAGPATASEKPAELLKLGRKQYLNGDYDGAAATFAEVQSQDPSNREAQLFQGRIGQITSEVKDRQKGMTRQQMLAQVSQSWERPKVFDVEGESDEVVNSSILHKEKSIVIPRVNFSGMPLSQVIATLNELSVEYDPEQVGVPIEFTPVNGKDPRVNISLRNLNLDRIVEFVTQQVNHSYEVTDSGIRVQPAVAMAAAPKKQKATLTPKAEKQTVDAPISTFSLNVSNVSFKLAQAALNSSRVPDASLIRSEEFVNSFDYRDPIPQGNEAVSLNWEIADLPYAHGRQVIRFSLQTQAAGRMKAQPLNLHLLVDNSGSMQRPDRRAILEQSLQSLKDKLQPQDELSIVLFARQPKLIANASTHDAQQVAVDQALAYRPEGGTNLEAGLSAAYENAQRNFDPAASNRVILMTDGAANLGDVDGTALADLVVEQRKQGVALDAFGIGWDDYNDALLEEITRNGDGRYGFLNSAEDAAQDFSEKLAGSLRVAAADVKVQVIWNPERVTTYRQVGYDLHQLKTEDFRDNTVDAAEIGEAEAGTALYVVQINDDPNVIGSLGTLQVRYRDPSTGLYHEQKWPLEMPRAIPSLDVASPALRLATTSALFAERLANNPYARGYSFSELSSLTNDLPEAFPTQQRVVELQNMINNAGMLMGER